MESEPTASLGLVLTRVVDAGKPSPLPSGLSISLDFRWPTSASPCPRAPLVAGALASHSDGDHGTKELTSPASSPQAGNREECCPLAQELSSRVYPTPPRSDLRDDSPSFSVSLLFSPTYVPRFSSQMNCSPSDLCLNACFWGHPH